MLLAPVAHRESTEEIIENVTPEISECVCVCVCSQDTQLGIKSYSAH